MLILMQYIGVEAHHCEADQGIPLKVCGNNTVLRSNLAYLKTFPLCTAHAKLVNMQNFFFFCKM